MSVVLKHTFLDFSAIWEEASQAGAPRRRQRSTPPAVSRGEEQPPCEFAVAQLGRLDAIVWGKAKPERLGGKSPAASEVGSVGSTEASPAGWSPASPIAWNCYDADLDDEGAPLSPGSSPTIAAVAATQWQVDLGYPSVGSAGHYAGTCRPCAFARSPAGCRFGAECNFCHIVSEHPESVRMRPCKGKRERFKRTLAAIEGKIAQNPASLYDGSLSLPAFVDRDPQAKQRVMAQLAHVAAEACRNTGLVVAPR